VHRRGDLAGVGAQQCSLVADEVKRRTWRGTAHSTSGWIDGDRVIHWTTSGVEHDEVLLRRAVERVLVDEELPIHQRDRTPVGLPGCWPLPTVSAICWSVQLPVAAWFTMVLISW